MKCWLVLAGLLICTGTHAQAVLQGGAMREAYKLSGLGVVGRTITGETRCYPNAAGTQAAALLDAIGGTAVATLEWRPEWGSCRAHFVESGQAEPIYRDRDFAEIEYESAAIVYFEERDGFARVFEQRAPPGLWLRIADLPDGRLRPWAEVIVESARNYLGYEGLPLRAQPADNSPVLTVLREREAHDSQVHELIPTGEISGDWGKFDVIEWSSDFYLLSRTEEPTPTGNRWQGWLRLVTAEGEPELWFFTRD